MKETCWMGVEGERRKRDMVCLTRKETEAERVQEKRKMLSTKCANVECLSQTTFCD